MSAGSGCVSVFEGRSRKTSVVSRNIPCYLSGDSRVANLAYHREAPSCYLALSLLKAGSSPGVPDFSPDIFWNMFAAFLDGFLVRGIHRRRRLGDRDLHSLSKLLDQRRFLAHVVVLVLCRGVSSL